MSLALGEPAGAALSSFIKLIEGTKAPEQKHTGSSSPVNWNRLSSERAGRKSAIGVRGDMQVTGLLGRHLQPAVTVDSRSCNCRCKKPAPAAGYSGLIEFVELEVCLSPSVIRSMKYENSSLTAMSNPCRDQ